MEQSFISVERTRDYFDNRLENLNEIPIEGQVSTTSEIEKDCSVAFDKVFFSYNQDEKEVNYALKNVSFSIKKGEKVAFCGRTGSGKSSILNVLFKLYDIQSGEIWVEQKRINHMSLLELRKKIAIIPQFGFLFRASLRENLDPENTCSEEDLKRIVLKSGFRVKGKVKKEGDVIDVNRNENTNLDFNVENSGDNLSNGEKQIINFLRILIRNNDIICLDEATSNMDPKTDNELHEALFKFAENKTLIVITHKLEHLHRFDRVFVMEKGEIIEKGQIGELRKNNDGFFRK